MKSVKEADVSGKRVVVRCDFDVPIKNGEIEDDTRIKNNLPTLRFFLEKQASLFLIAHLGRPKSKDPNFSLKIIENPLSKELGKQVAFQEDINQNPSAAVTLFENLRYWPEEEKSDPEFSKKLASFGEIYVNECFAACHRAHASIVELPKLLPASAGLNLIKEVNELDKILKNPERPLISIIGGAKLETKLPAINNLATVSDKVLVGGRLMFEVSGQSLPQNVAVASDDIDQKDIGPKSIDSFTKIIQTAKTIVWNGPLGVFEVEKYMKGTHEVAEVVVGSDAYKLVGGGDTIAALDKLELLDKIDYVSTGGGAMLEFLAGKKLPGLVALGYYD